MRQHNFALTASRPWIGLVWAKVGSEVHSSDQGQGSDSGLSDYRGCNEKEMGQSETGSVEDSDICRASPLHRAQTKIPRLPVLA